MANSKRELIDAGRDKRYVKRNEDGTLKESDGRWQILAADVRRKAKTKVKPGHGDQGDQPKRAAKKQRRRPQRKLLGKNENSAANAAHAVEAALVCRSEFKCGVRV
jgi:hypothetical protein